ncbi:tRNA (adenosine(37)-N6)-dimethylallyltransferase MiaA [Geothrix sp. 21YS21S-4]|uniref:tRNA (adenosine(37)-N6)-dimethylallyltransferase MiaA n=1 Tax=Geothrix sp. 21YS21S-4 TaxID=3068889 RepID=UPI0027BA6CB7|nr:tRNA (adenosine(37)-N6)-dimethylallyltransferase MiaA [Geothrix sp. 21YS21S-4]
MPIAILGPTASGKSAVAVAVARRLGGTVVNGDPYQALAGLAIGTGQPDAEERGGVPHAGYGELPLSARPNPAEFGAWVRDRLAACREPVLVTGSGLYLRGIWNQLSPLPAVDPALVERVRRWGDRLGIPALHRYLAAVDPARAGALHPNDGARVQRALALHLASGRAPSVLLSAPKTGVPEGWKALVVSPGRERRRARVAARVAAQVKAGWPAEVAALVTAGHAADLEVLRPLGYARWMAGGASDAVQAAIVQETQAYAKRQDTWFRNQLPGAPAWDPDTEPLEAAFARLGFS